LPLALPRAGGELLVPLPALSAPAARVEARLLLPAGRSYALADATREASSAAPPPLPRGGIGGVPGEAARGSGAARAHGRRGAEATPGGAIGRELLSQRGLVAGVAARPIPRPAGFAELLASWSALSANPAPLAVRVKSAKEENPWF